MYQVHSNNNIAIVKLDSDIETIEDATAMGCRFSRTEAVWYLPASPPILPIEEAVRRLEGLASRAHDRAVARMHARRQTAHWAHSELHHVAGLLASRMATNRLLAFARGDGGLTPAGQPTPAPLPLTGDYVGARITLTPAPGVWQTVGDPTPRHDAPMQPDTAQWPAVRHVPHWKSILAATLERSN